mmetsp:Transcript_54144/g.156366  ORF Transcript_54144/g.156366 Transcript_54144/m.156366 type:complete len:100 (+) Transcript_54144:60-359(+)
MHLQGDRNRQASEAPQDATDQGVTSCSQMAPLIFKMDINTYKNQRKIRNPVVKNLLTFGPPNSPPCNFRRSAKMAMQETAQQVKTATLNAKLPALTTYA